MSCNSNNSEEVMQTESMEDGCESLPLEKSNVANLFLSDAQSINLKSPPLPDSLEDCGEDEMVYRGIIEESKCSELNHSQDSVAEDSTEYSPFRYIKLNNIGSSAENKLYYRSILEDSISNSPCMSDDDDFLSLKNVSGKSLENSNDVYDKLMLLKKVNEVVEEDNSSDEVLRANEPKNISVDINDKHLDIKKISIDSKSDIRDKSLLLKKVNEGVEDDSTSDIVLGANEAENIKVNVDDKDLDTKKCNIDSNSITLSSYSVDVINTHNTSNNIKESHTHTVQLTETICDTINNSESELTFKLLDQFEKEIAAVEENKDISNSAYESDTLLKTIDIDQVIHNKCDANNFDVSKTTVEESDFNSNSQMLVMENIMDSNSQLSPTDKFEFHSDFEGTAIQKSDFTPSIESNSSLKLNLNQNFENRKADSPDLNFLSQFSSNSEVDVLEKSDFMETLCSETKTDTSHFSGKSDTLEEDMTFPSGENLKYDACKNIYASSYDILSSYEEGSSRDFSSIQSSFPKSSLDTENLNFSLKRSLSSSDKISDRESDYESNIKISKRMKAEECSPIFSNLKSEGTFTKNVELGKFNWDAYLLNTGSENVPPTAFQHVEDSLNNGIIEGQYLEVFHEVSDSNSLKENVEENKTDETYLTYWIAKVTSVCGPLIRVKYIGLTATETCPIQFWLKITSTDFHELGYGEKLGVTLHPPPQFGEFSPVDFKKLKMDLETIVGFSQSIPKDEDREMFARVNEGDIVEVLSDKYPHEGWYAEVKRNCGGRLLLQYFTPGFNSREEFWMFFIHPRLKPPNWVKENGAPFRYQIPECLIMSELDKEELLQESDKINFPNNFPFLKSFLPNLPKHNFSVGDYMEAVLPITLESVHVAVVTDVINDYFFHLAIDNFKWVTCAADSLIFPAGFCHKHNIPIHPPKKYTSDGFTWDTFLEERRGKLANWDNVPIIHSSAEDIGFAEGQKLEAVDPNRENKICVATVSSICGHLIWVKLDSDPNRLPFIRASSSTCIFPVGWSQTHGYALQHPEYYETKLSPQSKSTPDESVEPMEVPVEEKKENKYSVWCSELFINHCCHSGPYLSRTKVAFQPQSVGPGPLKLVLREVLSSTINAGYIPTRILRELQQLTPPNSTWHSTEMKAKFKRYIFKANVFIPSNALEVHTFLEKLSKTLQYCPNLWAFSSSDENCPYNCNVQNSGSQCKRRKGGKRKLFPMRPSINEEIPERQVDQETEAIDDLDEGIGAEIDDTTTKGNLSSYSIYNNSFEEEEATSRPQSPSTLDTNKKETRQRGAVDSQMSYEPAQVTTDPLNWTVEEVEQHILNDPSVCHVAKRIKEEEVDGRALLLLNLPSLIHHMRLPRESALLVAKYICKVKLAHFLYFRPSNSIQYEMMNLNL